MLYVLAESVGERLRQHNMKSQTIQLWIRDNELYSFERQSTLSNSTNITKVIADKAYELFKKNYGWEKPIRSLGVLACKLSIDDGVTQLSILPDEARLQNMEQLDAAVDNIRQRFGHNSIQRGIMLSNKQLSGLNPKDEHTIHPVAFYGQ